MFEKPILALLVRGLNVEMHAHHAVQLVVSLDRAYPATLGGKSFENIRGFLADSDVPHACLGKDSTVLILSVEAESAAGKVLRQSLKGKDFSLIEGVLPKKRIDSFTEDYRNNLSRRNSKFNHLELLEELGCFRDKKSVSDERIDFVISFILKNINTNFYISEIAAELNLSESRLRHFFLEKTGISIRSYILWTRIKIALREMLKKNAALSETAQFAGFSDHAHFSRIFRRMFGTPPSLLVKYAEFLEVFDL